MVTASHNHHVDNGVKIVESDGSMLVGPWESFSELIVNSADLAETLRSVPASGVVDMVDDVDGLFGVTRTLEESRLVEVIMAMDTRSSSQELVDAVKDGLDCFGVRSQFLGLKSTPQLHFHVAEEKDSAQTFMQNFIDFLRLTNQDT